MIKSEAKMFADREIYTALNEVFQRVFEDPSIELTPLTTADDIPGWDSMTQITLTVEIEHAMKAKFKTSEMEKMRSIGDLVSLLKQRIN